MTRFSFNRELLLTSRKQSPEQIAQDRERYSSLKQQIPFIYAVALANFFGLKIVADGGLDSLASPIMILVVLILWRLVHWIRIRGQSLAPYAMRTELKKTLIFTALLSGGFSIWAQLLLTSHPAQIQAIVLFSSLAAVGCTYGLSNYPPAACLPLLMLGLPLGLRLILSGQTTQIGMGVSLLLTIFLVSRLLRVQNRRTVEMVASRSRLDQEQLRAREAERQANLLAATDSLTGIANRRALVAAMTAAAAAEPRSHPAAIVLIDLDGFKPINDAFGHPTGDAVLVCVAERLKNAFGRDAIIARMGGDEFAMFWTGERKAGSAGKRVAEICTLIEQPMTIEHRVVQVQCCCGFTRTDTETWNPETLLNQSDTALYAAKRRGTGRFAAFSRVLMEGQKRAAAIERKISAGDAAANIEMVFQPISALDSGEIVAYEALARWHDTDLGTISPDEFIRTAEQMNLIAPIGERTLTLAVQAAAAWPDHVRLSFNVSAVQLCTAGAAERLLAIMQRFDFDPRRLLVEVTETALLSDIALASTNLALLRQAGAAVALDDFGAGNASISYLREMSFDVVKLDGSLVTSLCHSPRNRNLMRGLIDLCRALGVVCIAEHVENATQFDILREMGCDQVQGFLIGEPMSQVSHQAEPRKNAGRFAA
ncbi:EAL domain-containing protein [Sphingorhabdus soli]|uniref:EAL domain-containing protein n=1 Tax=Flavisphingopyxis soli TaxID=2601267 RepID=A0A5C6U8E5_9SPHN|nr:EAL domain-containing protein [Sphingorhabdus soli]TXC68660.1 EAL domain-containing protein [Sphingorhabdus soli]